MWKGRKKAFGAMGRIAPDLLVQDATVPRTKLPYVLAEITQIGERYGLKIANVFHAGDGNLHLNLIGKKGDKKQWDLIDKVSQRMVARALAMGGTATGEHGVGIARTPWMQQAIGDVGMATHRALKKTLDPRGILNPGKILANPAEVSECVSYRT